MTLRQSLRKILTFRLIQVHISSCIATLGFTFVWGWDFCLFVWLVWFFFLPNKPSKTNFYLFLFPKLWLLQLISGKFYPLAPLVLQNNSSLFVSLNHTLKWNHTWKTRGVCPKQPQKEHLKSFLFCVLGSALMCTSRGQIHSYRSCKICLSWCKVNWTCCFMKKCSAHSSAIKHQAVNNENWTNTLLFLTLVK